MTFTHFVYNEQMSTLYDLRQSLLRNFIIFLISRKVHKKIDVFFSINKTSYVDVEEN